MGRLSIVAALACGTLAFAFAPAAHAADDFAAEDQGTLADAIARGRFELQLRPRWNRIDESDKPERTEGGTFRSVAGWRSAPWHGLRLTAEGIYSFHVGRKDFNDDGAQFFTSPYPLLPDPKVTDANQLHVEYTLDATRIRAGRQIVRLDNQRWVSDNDFRQTPQLLDGVTVANTSLPNAELYGGYFTRMRDTSGVRQELKLTLLHAAYNPLPGHSIAAYAYYQDQPVQVTFTGFANSSYRVAGVRAEGSFATPLFRIPYEAEWAQQKPYAGGDARIDADYWRVGGGVEWRDLMVRADNERKESNGGRYGVQMPLTDFYAFNGWTLHFFNTPAQGLDDRWITLRCALRVLVPVTLDAEWHRFHSDFGSLDFGHEADMRLTFELRPNLFLHTQHARYEPGPGQVAPSIHKTWITLNYTY